MNTKEHDEAGRANEGSEANEASEAPPRLALAVKRMKRLRTGVQAGVEVVPWSGINLTRSLRVDGQG